jgi:hypothetical protein
MHVASLLRLRIIDDKRAIAAAPPTLASFSALRGAFDSTVTLTGSGFTNVNSMTRSGSCPRSSPSTRRPR